MSQMQPSSANRLSVTRSLCSNQSQRLSVRKWNRKCRHAISQRDTRKKWSPAGCLPVVGSDMMTGGGNTCSSDRKSHRPCGDYQAAGKLSAAREGSPAPVRVCLSLFRRAEKGQLERFASGENFTHLHLIRISAWHVALLFQWNATLACLSQIHRVIYHITSWDYIWIKIIKEKPETMISGFFFLFKTNKL